MILTSTSALLAALRSAAASATLLLAPGSYPGVTISGVHFASPVTIASADPSHPATLVGLTVKDSQGLVFRDLEVAGTGAADPFFPLSVTGARDVAFEDIDFHGNPRKAPENNRWGMVVLDSASVRLTGCRIHDLWAGITANDDDGLTIENSIFSNLDKGGVEMGGSSNVTIAGNLFEDFHVGRGTHADAVQVYTATPLAAAHDIAIVGNLVWRGRGDPVQGLFVQDALGTRPIHTLTITDNAVLGGMWNSIYVKGVTGAVVVDRNIIASWRGADLQRSKAEVAVDAPPVTTDFIGWIFLRGELGMADRVTQDGNRAQAYMGGAGRSVGTPPGNESLGAVRDKGAALLGAWLAAHPGRSAPG